MASILFNNNGSAQARSALSLENDRVNPVMVTRGSKLEQARTMWDFFFNKPADTRPQGSIPVLTLTREQLLAAEDNTVWRFGHSTVLMKLQGAFWITDPIFSHRASPIQFAGPDRFHRPPISIEELPPIKGVIISHDHYDHLDHASIMRLAGKTELFLTPLGVGDILVGWGVSAAKVRQLDWWQETEVGGVRLAATPAQHFSGRGLFNRNGTQWVSWVILAGDRRLFFSGDSGYFGGFRQIGDKYGPFDLTMLETGAYNGNWPNVHMHPQETIQAHMDLGGKRLMPIHNGTFDLSMHAWHDPFDRIVVLGDLKNVPVITPVMGEAVSLCHSGKSQNWWGKVDRGKTGERAQHQRQSFGGRL